MILWTNRNTQILSVGFVIPPLLQFLGYIIALVTSLRAYFSLTRGTEIRSIFGKSHEARKVSSNVLKMVTNVPSSVTRYNVQDPKNASNDRFILSKGHAAPILYAAWAEAGLFPLEDLVRLSQSSNAHGYAIGTTPLTNRATRLSFARPNLSDHS